MSHGSRLLPCNEIIARVTDINGDPGKERGDGYYYGLIQRALKALSYETLFDKRTFSAPISSNYVVALPPDFANIEAVHLFSGAECNMLYAQPVYHTPMYRTGRGAVLKENMGFGDQVHETSLPGGFPSTLYTFDVQQGNMMLSSTCGQYESVFVQYYGLGTIFGEEPLVPMVLEEAVVYWVALRSLEGKLHDPGANMTAVRDSIRNCKDVLYGSERVWDKAIHNATMPDIKAMADHNIYKAGTHGSHT
jgi:hypothetical protein